MKLLPLLALALLLALPLTACAPHDLLARKERTGRALATAEAKLAALPPDSPERPGAEAAVAEAREAHRVASEAVSRARREGWGWAVGLVEGVLSLSSPAVALFIPGGAGALSVVARLLGLARTALLTPKGATA